MKAFNLKFLDTPSESKFVKILYKFLVILLFAYMLQATFVKAMYSYTDHDDNPYIAGAKLTSEEGLLPYKDYRCIHMPYYVFAYSLILKATPSLTFTARMISMLSFFSILILIFYSIQNSLSRKNQIFSFAVGASALIFLQYNPFTQQAFARFTYDFPLFLSILSFLTLISLEKKNSILKAAVSGLLLGIAIGFRINFIILTAPFALSLLLFLKHSRIEKIKLFVCFTAGVFIGLIPVFFLFAIAPKEFIFDIHQFHFNIDMKAQPRATLPIGKKISTLILMMCDKWQSLVLLITTVIVIILKFLKATKRNILGFRINVLLITMPFLVYIVVGKLVLPQYLYLLSVFMILFVFYGFCTFNNRLNYATILLIAISIIMLSSVKHRKLSEIIQTETWYALERYRTSQLIDEAIRGNAKILTLSPAEVIESDSITIYKEFVSSPFIWRTSHSIADNDRDEFNILSKKEIDNFLQENQPDAILTGYYSSRVDWEKKFVEYAINNGYKKIILPTPRELELYLKE